MTSLSQQHKQHQLARQLIARVCCGVLVLLAGCDGICSAAPRESLLSAQQAHATGIASTATPDSSTATLPPNALRAADVPTVVATVDGKPVARWLYISQVNFGLWVRESPPTPGAPWTWLSRSQVVALERQALRKVVENALIVRYGERHGWAPASTDLQNAYARVVQRRGGPAASVRQIAQEYLTMDQDRVVLRNSMVAQQVLDHFIAARHQPVVALSMRLITTPSLQVARRVRAQLLASGQWVALAGRYSVDAIGRAAGGEQPIGTANQFDPRLWQIAYHLVPGTISPPVHIADGWVIVQVLRRLPDPAGYRQDLTLYQAWLMTMVRHTKIWSYLGTL